MTVHKLERDVDRRSVVVHDGPAQYQTPIGRVSALIDGRILLEIRIAGGGHGEMVLSIEDASNVRDAFGKAASVARRRAEYLSGFYVIRVAKTSTGEVRVGYRGHVRPMRLRRFRGRYGGHCEVCKEHQPVEIWTAVDLVDICAQCVDKLAAEPDGLRKVEGGGVI